jgi:TP901 family phage tail tape measure protein
LPVQEFKFTFDSKNQDINNKDLVKVLNDLKKSISTSKSMNVDVDTSTLNQLINRLINSIEKQQKSLSSNLKALADKIGVPSPTIAQPAGQVSKSDVLSNSIKNLAKNIDKLPEELLSKKVAVIDLETGPFYKGGKYGAPTAEKKVDFITQIGVLQATLKEILTKTEKELREAGKFREINVRPQMGREAYKQEYLTHSPKFAGKEIDYDKLLRKGKPIDKALNEVSKILEDAAIIAGHNITDFDMHVLEGSMKDAGVKIDLASKEFYDTLKAAQKSFNFGNFENKLDKLGKDLEDIGRSYKGTAHEAVRDVAVTADLMKALAGRSAELNEVMGQIASKMEPIVGAVKKAEDGLKSIGADSKKLTDSMARVEYEFGATSESLKSIKNSIIDASKVTRDYSKKATIDIAELAQVRSMQAAVFKSAPVYPTGEGTAYFQTPHENVKTNKKLEIIVDNLSKSLNKLQINMVKSLESGLRSGWKIFEGEKGEKFRLGKGGREWELTVVDVNKIRRQLKGFDISLGPDVDPKDAIRAYKEAFVKREESRTETKEDVAAKVERWLSRVNSEDLSKFSDTTKLLAEQVKGGKLTGTQLANIPALQDIYKATVLETKAVEDLRKQFFKTITVPAAQLTPQGTLGIETKYGAERSLANFATITTGLERLAKEFNELGGDYKEYLGQLNRITELPFRPDPTTQPEKFKAAQDLATELIQKVRAVGGKDMIYKGLSDAVKLRMTERGMPKKSFNTIDQLEEQASKLGVTSLDVAKALDRINFENFYDVLDKLYQTGKTPFITEKAKGMSGAEGERSIRQIAKVKDELLGIMPLVEPGRPKRRAYDEEVIKIATRKVASASPYATTLRPEEQKKHIVDVALVWQEMADNARKLGKPGLYMNAPELGIPEAKPIDLSDSASSQIDEFNKSSSSALRDLNKTVISASTAGIRGLAPFEKFSSISRQMSYSANALAGALPKGDFELPSLVSERERGTIEAGKYGKGGYGLNVLTELRNTAATFEDQIVISGRLAEAFTRIVKPLVGPAASMIQDIGSMERGKLVGATARGKALEAEARGMDPKDFEKLVGKVTSEYQDILGVPKTYQGRADVAQISDEIQNVMRVHRGESIEVQTAKLSETFLNYFGRKLSTRFGTKGVSISAKKAQLPEGISSLEDVASFMKQGFKTKVAPGAGLGIAKMPKSMGQLLSELLAKALGSLHAPEAGMELHNRLIASGNKFVIDMFKDASQGLVTEEEAAKQNKLFKDASEAFRKVFVADLPEGKSGIEEIKNLYKEVFGEEKLSTLKPIEARISARGIAKRGLMPEVLEGLVNNLIGSIKYKESTTILDTDLTADPVVRKKINEYLKALTYSALEDPNLPEQSKKEVESLTKRLRAEGASTQDIERLKDFEKQWSVYTDVVDEYGKTMKSFVAPKFLQVVEEPHLYKEWSERDVSKGVRGERLNFQAFAAYAGVFGEGSQMMEELSKSTSLTSREGWELIRALQMLDPSMKDLAKTMTESLKTIELSDVETFTGRTAEVKELVDTIFDVGKFPAPFKLKIPSTAPGKAGEYEDLYVPGPAARATYPEEIMGGRVSPNNIARYLSNLVERAKNVENLMAISKEGNLSFDDESARKFATTIRAELTEKLTSTYKEFAGIENKGTITPANIEFMKSYIDQLKGALSPVRHVSSIYMTAEAKRGGLRSQTELESVESYERQLRQTDPSKMYSKLLSRIMDILIGAQPESLKAEETKIEIARKKFSETGTVPKEYAKQFQSLGKFYGNDFDKMLNAFQKRVEERRDARASFDIELEAGNLKEFADNVGINLHMTVKESLERALQSLSRARVSYYEELAKQVIGPKHGIEQTFFQRTIPSSVMAKAVTAVTDKTRDLDKAIADLSSRSGSNFDNIINKLKEIKKEHIEYIEKAKQLGMPVLKEGEIGIHPEMAKQIKLKQAGRESDLSKLLSEQLEEAYVTTVRYPFTGTLSVQPHKAKLMETGLARHSLAVPGAPEMNIADMTEEVIKPLREHIDKLVSEREQLWESGGADAAQKTAELSKEIEGLVSLTKELTPKFVNMEQKLDFDGDALFLHTGQVEESRQEIKKHFEALGSDVTSVRSLFNTLFTAVEETNVKALSEMAYIFGKKQPMEKGFQFLEKPYIEKEVKNLNLNEVLKALSTYSSKGVEFGDWVNDYLNKQVFPEVFRKAGGTEIERSAFAEKATAAFAGGGTGIPMGPDAGEFEKTASKLFEEMIRRRLWEQKYSDAIVGQLYKLQTGQTVEGISRVARLTELETGFGAGLAGTGKRKFEPAAEFLEKWPKESIVLGERPVQEFAARMNEILRFVIQKGLDEKHAGVEAVGKHIIANVGKKGGAEAIMRIMEKDREKKEDQFKQLWQFDEQIKQEAKLRLGKHSTETLREELKRFQPDMAEDLLAGMSRQDLIDKITKQVDLSALFEELFRMIKRQAIKGYVKELQGKLKEMPVEQRAKEEANVARMGGFEPYARKKIEEESVKESGISILKYVTTNLEPLYKLRTSMENIGTIAGRTKLKPEVDIILPEQKREAERLKDVYENTLKTAHVLSKSIEGVVAGAQGGAHAMMVLSSVQKRLEELSAISKRAEELGVPMAAGAKIPTKRMEYAGGAYMAEAPALFEDIWSKALMSQTRLGPTDQLDPMESWKKNVERLSKVKKQTEGELEGLSQTLGIPMIGKEEKSKVFFEFSEKNNEVVEAIDLRSKAFGEFLATKQPDLTPEQVKRSTDEYAQFMTDLLKFQVAMSEQARRISEAMKAVPFQKTYLEKSFTGLASRAGKSPTEIANEMSSMESSASKEFDKEIVAKRERRVQDIQDYFAKQRASTAQSMIDVTTLDKPQVIPDRDLSDKVRQAAQESIQQIAEVVNENVIYKTRQALKGLERRAGGGATAGGEEKRLSELYRASGLSGGGGYGGVPQPEAILKQMLGLTDPNMLMEATAFRGTALHRRKQLEMGGKYRQFGGFELEGLTRYIENGQDLMTGHFDVIYKESEEAQRKLADIKTIYSGKTFKALATLADNIKKGGTTLDSSLKRFEESRSAFDQELARRLKSYISQINFYLESNKDAIGEIILVSAEDPTKEAKIEIGGFDPSLFAKDIQVVKDAKMQVAKLLESLSKTNDPEAIKSLLGDYKDVYEALVDKLGEVTFETVSKALPTRPTFEALEQSRIKSWEEFASTLNREDQDLFEKLSAEYLTAFERMRGPRADKVFKKWRMEGVPAGGAGAPPAGGAPPGGAGGGDGFDDDEFDEFRKKIQAILNKLRQGVELDPNEVLKLMEMYERARREFNELMGSRDPLLFKELTDKYQKLINEIKQTVSTEYKGGFESAYRMYNMSSKVEPTMADNIDRMTKDYSQFRKLDIETEDPDRPEAVHKNLKALFEIVRRRHGLVGSDTKKFGGEIESLIESVTKEGPGSDISRQIIAAVDKLPKEKRGYTVGIWKHYRKAVSEYFLKELDRLQEEIESARTEDEARESYAQYEKTLRRFRETIVKNLGKVSDIYTEKAFGGTRETIEPGLAKLTGTFRTKEEIAEIARASSRLSGEFQPIVDMLIGEGSGEDIEALVSPIEKVRLAFEMLTSDAEEFKKELTDEDAFRRFGDQIAKKWNFDKTVKGVTQLRAALESWNRMQIAGVGDVGPSASYTEAQRKNIEETIKLLRQLEKSFVPTGGTAASEMGLVGVPGFLSTSEQEALHKRNIAMTRKYFATPKEEGGPERDRAFTYRYKIVDPSTKQVVRNVAEEFRSLGDTVDSTGQKMGVFTQKTEDLLKQFQERRGFGQAFGRVIRWGLASNVVYGSVKALKSMVSTISDVEYGIAVLRQVMSPLETNFEGITAAAVNFAKEFGLPIRNVIDSMRVFAQQGLAQADVIDRTRTSTLAANVTTLSAADATEALTAATKVYGREGQSTLRFLDSWSQVEARHAITSADLANALKKAAAAAKTSGVDFDQLNAIVTGIGETSRQTGKEIGTSLRFMFRRLQGEKGPKELGKIGVPVLTPQGDIRSGFEVLGQLADKWNDLNQSQRLAIAQAIGGRRHYNSLIILMDHWGDVLDTLQDSINSKGAAERRNAIVMDTYAKKLEQVRASLTELQLQFGKFALPIAKGALTGLKLLIETISNIPTSVKIAFTAVASFFTLLTKGSSIFDKISNTFTSSGNIFGDFIAAAKSELSKGVYEIFGKGIGGFSLDNVFKGINTKGLKQFTEATSLGDLESGLGKSVYVLAKVGRSWNNFLTDITKGGASVTNKISNMFDFIGDKLISGGVALGEKGGPAAIITGSITAALGSVSEMAGYGTEKVAKMLGITAEQMARLTRSSTGVVGALAPMIGSFFALKPLLSSAWDNFKKLALSAGDYEKSMGGLRMLHSGELERIKDLGYGYDKLSKRMSDINKSMLPDVKARQQEREEYKSPLHELGKLYGDATEYGNKLASTNIDLVSGFDQFGNAILKTTGNMKGYLKVLESAQQRKMAETELDVLGVYVKDLTKTTGLETFKNEFKKFLAEIPVVGEALAKTIKVSPAKSLEELREKVGDLIALRNKYPLTTSFDIDLNKYNTQLAEVRKSYKQTYDDFLRTLSNVPVEGLNPAQISEMFSRPEFKEGFEVIANIEPRLQTGALKGKVDWQDILGTEVLKKLYPNKPLDFTSQLTKGLLEQANISPRDAEAFSGDIVLFTDEIAKKYEMAGNQAILKMQKTSDGVVKWTVQFFDKELSTVKELPFDKVSKFVDSIFPVQAISDRLYENVEVLKEFVAGAGAGLRGITENTFKKDFSLGERFFSQLPTTTLLQTTKGFEPGRGFGEVPFKSGWDKWIDDNFFKPMTEYTRLLEQLKPADLPTGESELAPGLTEDIASLQDVLKNNQVVIQYRAVHEDLIKSISEGNRVLKENIAAERNRNAYLVQSSGYLKGFSEDMSDINLGVKKYTDLTLQQRLAFKESNPRTDVIEDVMKPVLNPSEYLSEFSNAIKHAKDFNPFKAYSEFYKTIKRSISGPTYTDVRQQYKEGTIERQSIVDSITNIDKSLIAVREIGDVARSFGAALPTQELENYIEEIAKTGDRGTGLLLGETKKVESNTAATVNRLDQILEQGGDTAALERIVEKTSGRSDIIDKLEYLTERRNKAAKKENTELVTTYDRAIDKLTSKLVSEVGPEKALKYVGKNAPLFFGTQDYTQAEFTKRALGNTNFEGFSKALERVQPGITKTKEFTDLISLQQEQSTEQVVSNKNLQKLLAVYSTMEHFNKVSTNRQVKALDDQLGELEIQRKELQKSGAPTEDITSKIEELTTKRGGLAAKASGQAMREIIAPIALASQEIAKSFGVTDRQLRILGGTIGGTYLAWKAWNKLTGEPMPEYIEELGAKSAEAAQRMSKEGISGKAWRTYYAAKDVVFGKNLDEKLKEAEKKIKEEEVLTEEEKRQATEKVIYAGRGKEAPLLLESGITDKKKPTDILRDILKDFKDDFKKSGETIIQGGEKAEDSIVIGSEGFMSRLRKAMPDKEKFGELKDAMSGVFKKYYGKGAEAGAGILGSAGIYSEERSAEQKELSSKVMDKLRRLMRKYGIKPEEETVIFGGERAEESEVRRPGKAESLGQAVRRAVEYTKAKDKARPTDDKILDENSAQTGILHGIYEQTKRTAENTTTFSENLSQEMKEGREDRKDEVSDILTNVDKLRSEYLEKAGTRVSPLKQIVAALLAATTAGYVSEKSEQRRRNNELENRAEKQAELVDNIIKKYPDVISKAIGDFNTTIVTAGEGLSVETEKIQKAVDTEAAEKNMVSRLEELRNRMTESYEDVNKSMEEAAQRMAELELAEEMKKQLEDLDNAIKSSMAIKNLEKQFSVETSGLMAGKRVPQIQLGTQDILDLSPAESLVLKEDYSTPILGSIKRTMGNLTGSVSSLWERSVGFIGNAISTITLGIFDDTYSDLAERYEQGTSELSQLMEVASNITTEMTALRAGPMTGESKARYEALEENLDKITSRMGDLNESLIKTSISLQGAIAAEELRIRTLKTEVEASSQFSRTYAEAMTPTDPFSYLGRSGLGSGGFGLELPKTPDDLTVSERTLLEAREANNKELISAIQQYSALKLLIGGQNQQLGEAAGKISNLIVNYREQSKILGEYHNRTKATKSLLDAQIKAYSALQDSMSKSVEAIKKLDSVQSGLNFGRLINDLQGLKKSYLETSSSNEFRRITEGVDKILGGSHPLAKVAPTYAALQAGVPEDQLLNMDKYQLRMAELLAQPGPGPTLEQINAIKFGKTVDMWAYEQGKQNDELRRQREQAIQYNSAFSRAIRTAEYMGKEDDVNKLKKLQSKFIEESKTMAEVKEVDESGVSYYQGIKFDKYIDATKDMFDSLGIGDMESNVATPIITSIDTNTKKIVDALQGKDPYDNNTRGFFSRLFGFGSDESPVDKKWSGGFISGPGGPREDRVLASVSPGEYVIKASSTKKIKDKYGMGAFNTINSGELPHFAEGGDTKKISKGLINEEVPEGMVYDHELGVLRKKVTIEDIDKSLAGFSDFKRKLEASDRYSELKIQQEVEEYMARLDEKMKSKYSLSGIFRSLGDKLGDARKKYQGKGFEFSKEKGAVGNVAEAVEGVTSTGKVYGLGVLESVPRLF